MTGGGPYHEPGCAKGAELEALLSRCGVGAHAGGPSRGWTFQGKRFYKHLVPCSGHGPTVPFAPFTPTSAGPSPTPTLCPPTTMPSPVR